MWHRRRRRRSLHARTADRVRQCIRHSSSAREQEHAVMRPATEGESCPSWITHARSSLHKSSGLGPTSIVVIVLVALLCHQKAALVAAVRVLYHEGYMRMGTPRARKGIRFTVVLVPRGDDHGRPPPRTHVAAHCGERDPPRACCCFIY